MNEVAYPLDSARITRTTYPRRHPPFHQSRTQMTADSASRAKRPTLRRHGTHVPFGFITSPAFILDRSLPRPAPSNYFHVHETGRPDLNDEDFSLPLEAEGSREDRGYLEIDDFPSKKDKKLLREQHAVANLRGIRVYKQEDGEGYTLAKSP